MMHFTAFRRGAVLAALIGGIAGCAGTPSSPPPAVVVATSPPARLKPLHDTPMAPARVRVVEVGELTPMPRVVLVDTPPPPPKPEVIPPRGGGARQIWLPGHWRYYGRHYVWIGGRWEAPPRPGARYSPPHWETRGKDHLFFEGYWQAS